MKYTESHKNETTGEWEETERDMTPLEEEFANLVKQTHTQIDEKIDAAAKLISEAEDIASAHGVAFYSRLSPLGQSFHVAVLPTYDSLDSEFIRDILGMSPSSEYGDEGWEHSAVC